MDKLNKISVPAGQKLRQLQKIVHDIKKNDGNLMQKIKKFQNDQVALICKSGKETWDRITNRPPPPPPQRDYALGEEAVEEYDEWSDDSGSEYEHPDVPSDSETYVVPVDDSYEPPPTEPVKVLPPAFSFGSSSGGYADKNGNRKLPSLPEPDQLNKKTMRPFPILNQTFPKVSPSAPKPTQRLNNDNKTMPLPTVIKPKPQVAPRSRNPVTLPNQLCDDEEYVIPGLEDDNYIEPTQDPSPLTPPVVNRHNKPVPPTPTKSHQLAHTTALYEVPENEEDSPSPIIRISLPLPRQNTTPNTEQQCNEDYETCEDIIVVNKKETHNKIPSPLPRHGKSKPIPSLPQKPSLPPREGNSSIEPPWPVITRNNVHSAAEQEASVLNKEWYSSSCDRKTAEEALYTKGKDGSFLVRKSSGQDPKQPYTLVVFYNRRVYNIPVRFIEETRQYALGREKSGEEKFSSIAEMIENHQRSPLILIDSHNNTKDSTKLRHGVRVP
ncbi:hypothetical protein GDO86_013297 [Hymenochirus boettgeri]|uniref:SH2 domain-containing protein n=1 Tax=Hymenochirus boettgeri TaxID=247094 RepID=A0A8T2IW52_9PIPI|nr:hypothetical protein GDO86_013297 [Hymenochirus boettgeri]